MPNTEKKETEEKNSTQTAQAPQKIDAYQKYKDFKWEKPDAFKNGPIGDESRSCRDILCLFIFFAFIGGCVVVAVLGFKQGNPNLILYPYDEDANQCGLNKTKDYKFLYFYNSISNLEAFNLTKIANAICLKACPNETLLDTTKDITVDCWPTANNPNCKISKTNYYQSKGIIGRFCIPSVSVNLSSQTYTDPNGVVYVRQSDVNSSSNGLFNLAFANTDKLILWMGDLYSTWPALLASLGWSFAIALIFLLIVRCCAAFMIYSTIALILGSLITLGIFFHKQSALYTSVNDSMYHTAMVALAWTCYALALIWLLFILFMCNRIRLAVGLMEAAAKYIQQNCCIVFVPIVFFVFTGAFYTYWIFCSVYLYSSGEVDKSSTVIAQINWSSQIRYAWWFHLFALLYINEIIRAIAEFVYASSACIWYFTHEKGGAEHPISKSFKRVFRYHLGSIAFGALIVAIIKFIMLLMEYVKKKLDKTVGNNTKIGKIYKCLICCCQCCLNCIARVMEFINRHAYIQIALKGDSFCVAAWEGFGLIVRNMGRFSSLYLIGGLFNLFGMVFISVASGLIGYLLITEVSYFSSEINSPILPTFVMAMIGLVIGMICMSVFGMSADALMHAFLLDEEINKGQPKSYPELQKFMTNER